MSHHSIDADGDSWMWQRLVSAMSVFILAFSLAGVNSAASAKLPRSIKSAIDISWLPDVERTGSKFRDAAGKVIDPIKLMQKSGIEYGRIRIFTSNQLGHGTIARALKLAKRLKAENRKVILDFHLSDVWADPGNQSLPTGWSTTNPELLETQLKSYLRESLRRFIKAGISPDVVQVGNEIGNGFLWPVAPINSNDSNQWQQFVDLYNAGVETVRRVSPKSKILLHLHQPNADWLNWWWQNSQAYEIVDVDYVGISYYPNWHGDLAELEAGIRYLAETANQKVWIVETAYPWINATFGNDILNPSEMRLDDFGLNPFGQKKFVSSLQSLMRSLPKQNGVGIAWWEGLSPNAYGRGYEYRFGMQNSTLVNAKFKALPALFALGKG